LNFNQSGVVEALSFKLALDFVKYLKKNRVVLIDVRFDFYDKAFHEYITFSDQAQMEEHFKTYYLPVNTCGVGRLASIQTFRADSNTYNFSTAYRGIDITSGRHSLIPLSSYDVQRNANQDVFKQRQINFINNTINEYVNFYDELKLIFNTGIYSPCYAEPGWSENTWWLNELRNVIIQDNTDRSRFPYNKDKITKRPLK
jgi:hypothetical protein